VSYRLPAEALKRLHHYVLVSNNRTAFRFGVCDVWFLLAEDQAVNLIEAHSRVL
jgi:hypothetical protein